MLHKEVEFLKKGQTMSHQSKNLFFYFAAADYRWQKGSGEKEINSQQDLIHLGRWPHPMAFYQIMFFFAAQMALAETYFGPY